MVCDGGTAEPDYYSYALNVDGLRTLDPQNVHVSQSTGGNRGSNWFIFPDHFLPIIKLTMCHMAR